MSSDILKIPLADENEDTELLATQKLFRIRKYLLILVAIHWILSIIQLAGDIYSITGENEDAISSRSQSLIPIFALNFYYIFGLLVIYKYHRMGILIFAWVGTILFILTCLLIGYLFLTITVLGLDLNNIGSAFQFFAIFGLIFAIFATVEIVSLKMAFNLATLVKTNGYSIV